MNTDELNTLIDGDVLNDVTTLEKYATDASPWFEMPVMVVLSRHHQDCVQVVKFARENRYGSPVGVPVPALLVRLLVKESL